MSGTGIDISQLALATQANATDLIPATQGSIGPATGTTKAITPPQIIAVGGVTAAPGTNTTQLATTAFVGAAVTAAVTPLAPLASPALTGIPTVPTAAVGTSTTQAASTAFVQAALAASGWQTIATYAPSGVATQAIPLSSAFRRFRLTLQNMSVGTNAAILSLRFSSDGGSTYYATLYNYVTSSVDGAASQTYSTSQTATSILLSTTLVSPASGNVWDATFEIYPGSASAVPRLRGSGYGSSSSGTYVSTLFAAGWNSTPLVLMNFAEVIVSAGVFSGTIILEGLV